MNEQSPRRYLFTLNDALNDVFQDGGNFRAGTMGKQYTLKDVKLKWRNFVDDDEDNSKEEKYVKKAILDILKNKQSVDYLNKEL